LAEVRGPERARAEVMIAKGAIESKTITFALDVMLVILMYLLYDGKKCLLKSGKEFYRLVEETVGKVASITT